MVLHFELTGKERQRKLKSTGHFDAAPLCGNGSFHAVSTRHAESVTCHACRELLGKRLHYVDRKNVLTR